MPSTPDISVVIGFKDWGLTRLRLAVTTIMDSFGSLSGEVIVSDYGSTDNAGTQAALEALGATYVYTPTDGVWSRSRALNAGFAHSRGRVLMSTDADMIFSPSSMEVMGKWVLCDPDAALLVQCRDLPSQWSDAEIDAHGADWTTLERVARRRPRWGMGGMIAVSREKFLQIRGYDERMQTYGGEDIDFATRVRRAGGRLIWVEDPRVRMYHMWHPSTAAVHARSSADSADIAANKRIMSEDKTFVRNVLHWAHRPADAPPLVTVVIATYNRSDLILDTIHSVQAQTVQDFEIVVVDDGSTDDTRGVVASVQDSRIRYIWQENSGVAIARNKGIDESRGQYIVVMDDDDISLPWRIEAHFDAMTEGVHATFGSFANFDDETGEITLYRTKVFSDETTADKGGAPGHSTWMVDRSLMAALRYEEHLTSGIDNNFALRSLRSGIVWRHTGRVHSLRRMHPAQITAMHADGQASVAKEAYDFFTFLVSEKSLSKLRKERGSKDYVPLVGADPSDLIPFLPDHLVNRSILGEIPGTPLDGDVVCTAADGMRRTFSCASKATWADLAKYRGRIDGTQISAHPVGIDAPAASDDDPLDRVVEILRGESRNSDVADGRLTIELLQEQGSGRLDASVDGWLDQAMQISSGARRLHRLTGSVETGLGSVSLVEKLAASNGSLRITGAPKAIDQLSIALLSTSNRGEVR